MALARSPSWRRRSLGMDIAAQLRQRRGSLVSDYALSETQELLLAGLHDQHIEVVQAAVSGLGHRPHPAALDDLIRLSTHHNHMLRWSVTVSLGRYDAPAAINALLRLAADTHDAVRDWATFCLGSLQSSDTPEIRAVLWKNLSDEDADVRGEALAGLAARGDARAVEYVLDHLNSECSVYELDAAEKLATRRLLGPLQAIANGLSCHERDGYWFSRLQNAIAACSAGTD